MNDYLDLTQIERCHNKCIFCFVDQLPRDLRSTLYVKDEDFRYSYIYGNFITMTSLTQEDLDYIVDMNMSPLYISVHTMDKEVRKKMLNNKNAGKVEEQIEYLTSNGISLHCQIVLCPGWNDDKNLDYTLERLYSYTPYIDSVGIVPFGATCHREGLVDIPFVNGEISKKTFQITKKYSKLAREEYGVNWVYLADEFFIRMGKDLPSKYYYDNFPQIENGIGIARKFIDSFERSIKKYKFKNQDIYAICSKASEYIIKKLIKKYNLKIHLLRVNNKFFGETVSVTGLLTGRDIIKTIEEKAVKSIPVLIPDIIFNQDDFTLDDMSKEQIQNLDKRIKIIGSSGVDLARFFRSKK